MEYVIQYQSSDEEDAADAADERRRERRAPKRIRSFPHVKGQFATHVFFNIPINTRLESYINSIKSLDMIEPMDPTNLHVSLSRTVPITSVQIRSLLDELKKATNKVMRSCVQSPLDVRIGEHSLVLVNDEMTRSFLALSVRERDTNSNVLSHLVDAISSAFILHGLPRFYDEKIMHVSVAWSLEKALLDDARLPPPPVWDVPLHRIVCSIGCKEHILYDVASRVAMNDR
jgi:hypothetical protein